MIVKYFLPQLHKLSMLQESKTYAICSVAVHCPIICWLILYQVIRKHKSNSLIYSTKRIYIIWEKNTLFLWDTMGYSERQRYSPILATQGTGFYSSCLLIFELEACMWESWPQLRWPASPIQKQIIYVTGLH